MDRSAELIVMMVGLLDGHLDLEPLARLRYLGHEPDPEVDPLAELILDGLVERLGVDQGVELIEEPRERAVVLTPDRTQDGAGRADNRGHALVCTRPLIHPPEHLVDRRFDELEIPPERLERRVRGRAF